MKVAKDIKLDIHELKEITLIINVGGIQWLSNSYSKLRTASKQEGLCSFNI
jgi:hypothetical protein